VPDSGAGFSLGGVSYDKLF